MRMNRQGRGQLLSCRRSTGTCDTGEAEANRNGWRHARSVQRSVHCIPAPVAQHSVPCAITEVAHVQLTGGRAARTTRCHDSGPESAVQPVGLMLDDGTVSLRGCCTRRDSGAARAGVHRGLGCISSARPVTAEAVEDAMGARVVQERVFWKSGA
jgi:hypothetical protein